MFGAERRPNGSALSEYEAPFHATASRRLRGGQELPNMSL